MLRALQSCSIIIILFGRMSIVKTACNELVCSNYDESGISSLTISTLQAAEMQFERERESILPEFMQKSSSKSIFRITDENILADIERHRYHSTQDPNTDPISNANRLLSKVDSEKRVLRNGLVQVRIDMHTMLTMKLQSKTALVPLGSFCVVNIKTLNNRHPVMYARPEGPILYPNDDGNIILGRGKTVVLSCANGAFEFFPKRFMKWKCSEGHTFHHESIYMGIRDIKCKTWVPAAKLKDITTHTTDRTGKPIKTATLVFFDLIELFNICTNYAETYEKFYAVSTVSKAIKGGQQIDDNGRFKEMKILADKAWNENTIKIYEAQYTSFTQQFQGTTTDFCVVNNPMVIAPLVHPISLVYESLALNTVNSNNYSPQWRSISHNNWDTIIRHVNKMASHMQKDLTVVTGIHDDLEVRNRGNTGNKNLFLNYQLDRETLIKEMKIKLYFYKIVIETRYRTGVVFVTVNNPYIKTNPLYEICAEPRFPRLKTKTGCLWDPKYSYHGYSYTCNTENFFKTPKAPSRSLIMVDSYYSNEMPVEILHEISDEY